MGGRLLSLTSPPAAEAWRVRGHLWQCPACGKRFVQRGLWHSCDVVSLDHHFQGRPRARALFRAFRAAAVEEAGGPVRLSIARTRIGLITTITFVSVQPRKGHVRVGILLLRKVDSPRFVRIDRVRPYWVHYLDVRDETDIDGDLRGWLREAGEVGEGRRWATGRRPAPGPLVPARPRSRRH